MIQIDFAFYLLSALLLLVLPLDWLLAVVFAAFFHELCHILAVLLMRGNILRIRVKTGGCVMEAGEMGQWQQFFSILAGPLGSFFLLTLCHIVPKIAICGLLQGMYNLIPVLPLDGGRLMQFLLYHVCPRKAERLMDCVTIAFCLTVTGLAVWFHLARSSVPLFNIFALLWNLKFLSGKIPCKPPGIRVQ